MYVYRAGIHLPPMLHLNTFLVMQFKMKQNFVYITFKNIFKKTWFDWTVQTFEEEKNWWLNSMAKTPFFFF